MQAAFMKEAVLDLCIVCGGDDSSCEDCAGMPNGDEILDNCGTCDNDASNDCVQDCTGDWGGSAEYDDCDTPVCSGGTTELVANSSCTDCADVPNGSAITNNCEDCVINGDATDLLCIEGCDNIWKKDGSHLIYDVCGVCGGTETDDTLCITSCSSGETLGCDGICDSGTIDDECGVCGGNNSTCIDCTGTPNGEAVYDNCGEECIAAEPSADCSAYCDADSSNDCVQDCSGTWGGSSVDDECGVCGGNNSTCLDCADVPNGSAIINNCGVCVSAGDTTCVQGCDGIWKNDGTHMQNDECEICGGNNSSCIDCANIPNGNNNLDNCDVCNGESSNDCIQGCDGIWGSELIVDICEICGGDCFGDPGEECDDGLTDCEGNCVAEIDCQGICGGFNIPTFQCQNACVVCNPSDCINLDSDCNMDISPYLLPDEFGISKIFPNPFNPVTQIQYELTQFGLISIKIYDIQGRVVDQLINEYQSPGHYSLNWNAGNHASGMYIVEMVMQLENNEVSRDLQKILYLK